MICKNPATVHGLLIHTLILNLIFFQTLKDETGSDGTLMDDGKLDTSFPLMFEKWVNTVKQQDLQPSEQYPQKALG